MEDVITLAHGAGGRQTSDLIGSIFEKYFSNPDLTEDDAAVLRPPKGRMAMSTDGFIVSPAEFPGGNIGRLSICGTVNDLACMGAKPLYISCAFVIEEGFPVAKLDMIAKSMADTAAEVGVRIVSGDTKVAGKGQVDGVFITTTGVGEVIPGVNVGGALAKPGDAVIVTGDIGRHGCTILLQRDDFGMETDVTSDDAPLWNSVHSVIDHLSKKETSYNDNIAAGCDAETAAPGAAGSLHVIRDATRGGVGTVLYEIASQSNVGIKLNYEDIPVSGEVKGVCGMLGLEPLYLACEGRLVIFADKSEAEDIVSVLRENKYTEGAAIIGEVTEEMPGHVMLTTEIGTETLLPQPTGELLPRIC